MLGRTSAPRRSFRLAVAALGLALAVGSTPAYAENPVTPGNFTGYGFDQCQAPSIAAMDRWMKFSPFQAVGIYISGKSRACRNQLNLNADWVTRTQAMGWRLLPIALGPQASCLSRFPRYKDDFKIDPTPGGDGTYLNARGQGVAEATQNVTDAQSLGIVPGSTIWYDLEGFDLTNKHCRESALAFSSAWVTQTKSLGYVAGFYSSAGSGIKMLDDARLQRPGQFALPDQIWIARWDGYANTSTSYIAADGWLPGGRMKQYRGGHDETWGGVRINIDSNYLDLGTGSVAAPEAHCGGVAVDFAKYRTLKLGADPAYLSALTCLLAEQGVTTRIRPRHLVKKTLPPAARAWLASKGFPASKFWKRTHWVALLSAGDRPILKVGSYGPGVFRLQRALNAATGRKLTVTGTFDTATDSALRLWQARVGIPTTGVVTNKTWKRLNQGALRRR